LIDRLNIRLYTQTDKCAVRLHDMAVTSLTGVEFNFT